MKPETHPPNLDVLIDGEGSPAVLAAIEAHLGGCASCRAALAEKRQLSAALRSHATRYTAPATARERWRQIPATAESADPVKLVPFQPAPRRQNRVPRWFGMAASIALVASLSAGGMHLLDAETSTSMLLADEAISSHIRSLVPNHLYDVESTDQHTVKPWFAGKISFSPPVRDLAEQGFPLLGGRVDYLGRQEVAALVYRDRQHIINVFVWPAAGRAGPVLIGPVEQGYNTLHWAKDDMAFWAVSDVNLADLQSFAEHFRD